MPTAAGYITIGMDPRSPLETQIGQVVNKRYNLKLGLDSRDWALGRISKDAGEFEKSLKAAEARVLAFGATAAIINGVYKAFQGLVSSAYQVEKALVDINSVLGNSSTNLKKFGSDLFDIGKQTGSTFNQVAETAKEFSRQGLGVEQTLKRTRDAMILARISGLDMQSSVESITASLNSFNKAFLNSTEVVNKLAAVDQNFAVSAADLAEAVKRVGSTAEDAGVSFNELLGIVAAVQQTTSRGGAVIGNALKSIFTRIGRVDTIQDLQELGVQINNTQSGLQKLQAISDAIKLNPAIANQVKELAGGVYQINIVSAALKDLSKEYNNVARATDIASNATNEAISRNAELNKTLSAITNEALQNLTEFGSKAGQDVFGPIIKKVLGGFNEFSNTVKEGGPFVNIGSTIGEGLLKGIGQFLAGPGGFGILPIIFGKLLVKFADFAGKSVSSLLSFNDSAAQSKTILTEVNYLLSTQPNLVRQVATGAISVQEAQKRVLDILVAQTVQLETQAALAARIATGAVLSSGNPSTTPTGFKFKASGYVPQNSMAAYVESVSARSAGYTPGQVKSLSIPNYGQVIYNTNEKVVDFGLGQPAILPPKGSRAGVKYRQEFAQAHGFNPYMAGGFVPNFAINYEKLAESGKIKLLGRGAYGSVFDLQRIFQGVPVGVKTFNSHFNRDNISQSGIAGELALIQKLNELQSSGKIHPLFNFPRGFGNPIRAEEKGSFLKEIILGDTAYKKGIDHGFIEPLTHQLHYNLIPHGITPDDLHSNNIIPNKEFVKYFKELERKRMILNYAHRALVDKKFANSLSGDIAKAGGRLSIIDVGNFIDENSNFAAHFNNKVRASTVDKDIDVLTQFLQARGLAASGLIPAIAREASAGISPNQIRVGANSSLKSSANPLGLGVYNTFDEPAGLQQGITRAVASGYNPKNYGVPNFANTKGLVEFAPSASVSGITARGKIIDQVTQEIDDFRKKLQESSIGQDKITSFIREIGKKYELSDKSVGKLSLSLRATANNAERAKQIQEQNQAKLNELNNLGIRGSFVYGNTQPTFSTNQASISGGGTALTAQEIVSKGLKINKRPLQTQFSIVQKALDAQDKIQKQRIEDSSERIRLAALNLKDVQEQEAFKRNRDRENQKIDSQYTAHSIFSRAYPAGSQQDYNLIQQQEQRIRSEALAARLFAGGQSSIQYSNSNPFAAFIASEQAAKAQASAAYAAAKYGGQGYSATQVGAYDARTAYMRQSQSLAKRFSFGSSLTPEEQFQRKIGLTRESLYNTDIFGNVLLGGIRYAGNATSNFGDFSVFNYEGAARAKELKNIFNQRQAPTPNRINKGLQRFGNFFSGNRGIGIGLGAYLASGVTQEFIGDETLNKRRAGALAGVGFGALSGAATGAQISGGNPYVILGGAIASSALEIKKLLQVWNDNLPELVKNLESVKQTTTQTTDAIARYSDSTEKLNQIYSGEVSATPKQIQELRTEQTNALLRINLNEEQRQKIITGNSSDATDIFNSVALRNKQDLALAERDAVLGELNKDFNKFVKVPVNQVTYGIGGIKTIQKGTLGLTKEGEATIPSLLSGILSTRNKGGTGATLAELIQKDYEDTLKSDDLNKVSIFTKLKTQVGNKGKSFEDLKSFAAQSGFDETILTQIGQLGLLSTNTGGSLLSKELFKKVESIPDLIKIFKETENKFNKEVRQSSVDEFSFINQLLETQKTVNSGVLSRSQNLFNAKNLNSTLQAGRTATADSQLIFSDDTTKNIRELSNALLKIGEDAKEASLELENNFLNDAIQNISEGLNNIFTKSFNSILTNNNLPPERKNELLNIERQRNKQTFDKISGLNDVTSIKSFLKGEIENIALLEEKISTGTVVGKNAQELKQELEQRRNIVFETEKLVQEYEQNIIQLKQATGTQVDIAKLQADAKALITKATIRSNIGGALTTFGNEAAIGNRLYQLNNQVSVGTLTQDINRQIGGLSAIGNLYAQQGLRLPPDIQVQLTKAITESVQKQVSSGQLVLNPGETPEQVAIDKVNSEFGKTFNAPIGAIAKFPVILKDSTDEIESQTQLFDTIENQTHAINVASIERIRYEKAIAAGIKDGLVAQKELNAEVRKQLAAQATLAFKQNRITGDEYRQFQSDRRLADKELNGRLTGRDLGGAFFDQFKYNTRDFYDDLEEGAIDAGQTLKNSFKDAFREATDGTKSVTEALQDMGLSFLRSLGQRAFDIGVDSIFSKVFSGIGGAFGYGRSSGGIIKGYSIGGKVMGGSGVVDDVPAMLADGEYVVKKSSVNKYGIDFLDSINAGTALYDGTKGAIKEGDGRVNAVFTNAYTYNNDRTPTGGQLLIDPSLSSFALDDPNNPQNAIRFDREQALGQYLLDKKEYEQQQKEAYDAWRTQRRRALQAAWIQAGISAVGVGIQAYGASRAANVATIGGATGNTVVSQKYSAGVGYNQSSIGGGTRVLNSVDYGNFQSNPQSFGFSSSTNFNYSNNMGGSSFAPYNYSFGYRRAKGGPAIDNVPALLTGGEYVMSRKAVDVYGKEMMDNLNAGKIRKFATGGSVGITPTFGREATNENIIDNNKLIQSVELLRKSIDDMVKQTSSNSVGNTEIKININVDKNGSVSSSNETSDNKNKSKEDQKNEVEVQKALAKRIESVTRQVIIQELRPNGLLAG